MKVLYEVRDGKECNCTNIGTMSGICNDDQRVFNRVGLIEGLIVECHDAITRCPRTGCGDQAL